MNESPKQSWPVIGTGIAIVAILVAIWLDLRAGNHTLTARIDNALVATGDNAKAIGDVKAHLGRIEAEIAATRAELKDELRRLETGILLDAYRHIELMGAIERCLNAESFADFRLCLADARGMAPQGRTP